MFSQESKLAVLESKLGIYEDLSREMLAKLEAAVDKISEGNSRIATILAKHDERIEQSKIDVIDNFISNRFKNDPISAERFKKFLEDLFFFKK